VVTRKVDWNLREVNQLGFVVHDATRTADTFRKLFRLNPPVTLEAAISQDLDGQSLPPYRIRIVLLTLGTLQLEFIQILEGRPAIYCDFLDRCGEGLHHIGVNVPDINTALQQARDNGIKPLWSGNIYGVRWAYLDTQAQLGTILELIEVKPAQPLDT